MQKRRFFILFNGIIDTIPGWGKRAGISTRTLYDRLLVLQWDIERALTKNSVRQSQKMKYSERRRNGQDKYLYLGIEDTIKGHARRHGKPYKTILERVNWLGVPFEKAMEIPPRKLGRNYVAWKTTEEKLILANPRSSITWLSKQLPRHSKSAIKAKRHGLLGKISTDNAESIALDNTNKKVLDCGVYYQKII